MSNASGSGILDVSSAELPPTTASVCAAHGAPAAVGTFYADAHVSPTLALDSLTGAISLYYESGLWSSDESTARVMAARLRADVTAPAGVYYLDSAHGSVDGMTDCASAAPFAMADWDRVMGKVAAGNVLVVDLWREINATRALVSLVALTHMVDTPVAWTAPTLLAVNTSERLLGLWQSTAAPMTEYHLVTRAPDGRVLYRRSVDDGLSFQAQPSVLAAAAPNSDADVVHVEWRERDAEVYDAILTLDDGRRIDATTETGGANWVTLGMTMARAPHERMPTLIDTYYQAPDWSINASVALNRAATLALDLGGYGDAGLTYGPDVTLVSARTCTAAALTPSCFSNRPAVSACVPTLSELASSCRYVQGRHRLVRDLVSQATWVDAVIRRATTTAAGHRAVLLEQVATSTAAGFLINVELAVLDEATGAPLPGSPLRLAQYNARQLPRAGPEGSWTTGAAATSTAIVYDAHSGHLFVTYVLPYAESGETPMPSTTTAEVEAAPRSYVVVDEVVVFHP